MTEKKHTAIPCVGCCVNECKYNTVDNRCCAEAISVRNEKASRKDETYCSTFTPRGCC